MLIALQELEQAEWKGAATYRSLSYYFRVRWNFDAAGEYIDHLLSWCAVDEDPEENPEPPTPGMPPQYSLLASGRNAARSYRLLYGDYEMLASKYQRDVLNRVLSHVNVETMRRTGDFLLIHAGAIVTPAGDGVLLPAESGSGKTSLVAALVEAGHGYLSDEAGAIDPVSSALYPYPKALNLKAGVLARFATARSRSKSFLAPANECYLRCDDLRPGSLGSACHIGYVVAPRFQKSSRLEVTPMTAAETMVTLGSNAWNISKYKRRALPLLEDVATSAQGYRLRFGDLDEAVGCIGELCATERTESP